MYLTNQEYANGLTNYSYFYIKSKLLKNVTQILCAVKMKIWVIVQIYPKLLKYLNEVIADEIVYLVNRKQGLEQVLAVSVHLLNQHLGLTNLIWKVRYNKVRYNKVRYNKVRYNCCTYISFDLISYQEYANSLTNTRMWVLFHGD